MSASRPSPGTPPAALRSTFDSSRSGVHLAIDAVGQKQAGVATVLMDTITAAVRNQQVSTITVFCSPRSVRSFDLPRSPKIVEVAEGAAESAVLRLWWHERGLGRRAAEAGADAVLCLHSAGLTPAHIPHVTFAQRPITYSPEARARVPLKHRYRIPLIRHSMRRSCRSAWRVFVQTPSMREEVSRAFGVPPDRIEVAIPGPRELPASDHPNPALQPMRDTPAGSRVLFVGELFPHKNVEVAALAVACLQDRSPDLRLFVSSPPNRPLPELPGVVPLGFVPDDALGEAYDLADAFVMPSLHETVGLPMLEAMSAGTPVLAADRRYAHDVCEDAAVFFDPLDSDDLARKLVTVLSDASVRQTAIARGRALVERRRLEHPYHRLVQAAVDAAGSRDMPRGRKQATRIAGTSSRGNGGLPSVLIITNNFPPEMGAAAQGYHELALSLRAIGHEVSVVTGFPRYRMHERRQHGLFRREEMDGLHLVRIAGLPFDVTGPVMRGLDHLYLAASIFAGGLLAGRHDVVLAYSPPLTLGLSARALGQVWRVPSVVNVQDLFPKYAIDTGLMKNPWLIRFFEAMERFIYRHVADIVVHSEGNRDHAIAVGASPGRVSVIPNWADMDFITPGPRVNAMRREWGIGHEFIVQYSGTMGYQQDLDTVIEAARLLRDNADIVFVLIGDGVHKRSLEARVRSLALTNVIFPPMQPWERYPLAMQAADACPILLVPEVQTPGVPSKLFSIMSAGKPVILSVPEASDAIGIVRETGAGIIVPPGNPSRFAEAVLRLHDDPALARAMGDRGRHRAEAEFSRTVSVQKFSELFTRLAARYDNWNGPQTR